MSKLSAILTLFVLLIKVMCYGQNAYVYGQPQENGDGWKSKHLKSHDVDTTLIYKAFNQLKTIDNDIHSVLVIKNNHLIIEEYFKDHTDDLPHDLRSTTKSIRSILLGITIDKGYIENINDPIFKYLKSHAPQKNMDQRKNTITIKDLLTMSSGLDCNDWDKKSKGQEDRVYKKKDWIQYTLDLPMINDPGTVSNYCSMGVILIAEIISQATGMSIAQFAEKYLFNPLEIKNVHWGHTSGKKVLPSGKRLYMTPRDMAKIGQLMLNNGTWNKDVIVSKSWLKEATSPQTQITGIDYGYLWWNIPFNINNQKIISITATGNGGQYIMVVPALDMVAVFTGGAYNSQEDKLPFAMMNDILLPTFQLK